MASFYRERFANAADFTFFMVGAFKVDEALPLVARYVGSLPSTGKAASSSRTSGSSSRRRREGGRSRRAASPRRTTVLSFSPIRRSRENEQERGSRRRPRCSRLRCATSCARSWARPTASRSGLSQALPQRGGGLVAVSFGASPENVDKMIDARAAGGHAAAEGRTVGGPDEPREGNRAAEHETSLRQNGSGSGGCSRPSCSAAIRC